MVSADLWDVSGFPVSGFSVGVGTVFCDPRPDLSGDSGPWCELLLAAYRLDGGDALGLHAALDCLRCQGARLAVMPAGGARLVCDDEDYPDWRGRWLAPHRANLLALLAAVRV